MTTDGGWINTLFAAIDAQDAAGFASFLHPQARFYFGNAPAVVGREAIQDSVARFFAALAGLSHKVETTWHNGNSVACCGEVTYRRHDGSSLTVPFADVFYLADEQICEYRIYMDVSPLFSGD